ncbi:MAG TPA: FtsX-like permease family protein [Phycisphaerae bacterium]|nr:FtsX-like permease family protein [Phycisphaerae bacterium]
MTLPISYNWRNLFVRKLSTLLTFSVVAVIVGVLGVLLSFAEGIKESLRATGNAENIIVMRSGSTAESTSFIKSNEAAPVLQTPGIELDVRGNPLASMELCVQTTLKRRKGNGVANVAVRGVDDTAFPVHPEVRVIEGKRIEAGQLQVMVGKAAKDRYSGLEIGDDILLGKIANRVYKVVGVFEASAGALESEIWAPRSSIADSYDRRTLSSVVVRLRSLSDREKALEYLRGPAVKLQAKSETDYYYDLTSKTREIVVLTSVLIGLMSLGAVFAVANTMYAAVDGRKREIAMLRTIGFSRISIILAFILESLMICLSACLVGLAASYLVNGSRQDFLSDTTWTVLAYELRITPATVGSAFAMALLVGVTGGLAPALRASRTRIIEALRKA